MRVINLFAGPGAGKSTTAAGLFFEMKLAGHKVELVREYAKELVYEKDWKKLRDQHAILEEQDRRQAMIMDDVHWAITDSPLLLSLVYGDPTDASLVAKTWRCWSAYDNVIIHIDRVKPYVKLGRTQEEWEAIELDKRIKLMSPAPSLIAPGDRAGPRLIMRNLGLRMA